MSKLHDVSLLYVRLGMAVVASLFIGGFSFVIGSIAFCILVGLLFALFTFSAPMEALDKSFDSQPWGLAAWLVMAGEVASLGIGLWLAWKASAKLFQVLPDSARSFAPLSLGVFLLIETYLGVTGLSAAVHLALNNQRTTGRILEIHPERHGTVVYTYTVEGRRFDTSGSPEDLKVLAVGSPVQVYYLPGRAELNSLHKPWDRVQNSLLSSLMVGTFVTVAPLIMASVGSLIEAHRRL